MRCGVRSARCGVHCTSHRTSHSAPRTSHRTSHPAPRTSHLAPPHLAPVMIHLSVNVNKVATLRNSRGGREPSVLEAVDVCVKAGVAGITVHPRADRRHITPQDVHDIARRLEGRRPAIEFNIEGDPRPDLLDLVREVVPDQCTLVPVAPGEITSQAGWTAGPQSEGLASVVRDLQSRRIRVSLFIDPDAGGGDARGVAGRRSRGAVHRTFRARVRTRRRHRAAGIRHLRRGRRPGTSSGPRRSTQDTIWISTTWSCFANCRICKRFRSAMRSWLGRSFTGWTPVVRRVPGRARGGEAKLTVDPL